jgi:NDP-sugar pyrophosphorylase family protein
VSNCDILIDQDYEEVYKWHKENKNEITSIAAIKNYHIPYGTLEIGKDGLLESMKEKPDLTFFVNAGVYVVEPHLLHEVPKNEFFHITHLMEKVKKRGGRVGVFPVSEGSWMDIGNWVEYNKTQETFKKRFNKI